MRRHAGPPRFGRFRLYAGADHAGPGPGTAVARKRPKTLCAQDACEQGCPQDCLPHSISGPQAEVVDRLGVVVSGVLNVGNGWLARVPSRGNRILQLKTDFEKDGCGNL